jgi:hypothetical protein
MVYIYLYSLAYQHPAMRNTGYRNTGVLMESLFVLMYRVFLNFKQLNFSKKLLLFNCMH